MTTQTKTVPAVVDFANMTADQLRAEMARLQADNARLAQEKAEAKKSATFSLKVAEKGGVSIYGLGRFPVTAYASGMLSICEHVQEIAGFVLANVNALGVKGETEAEKNQARATIVARAKAILGQK